MKDGNEDKGWKESVMKWQGGVWLYQLPIFIINKSLI